MHQASCVTVPSVAPLVMFIMSGKSAQVVVVSHLGLNLMAWRCRLQPRHVTGGDAQQTPLGLGLLQLHYMRPQVGVVHLTGTQPRV